MGLHGIYLEIDVKSKHLVHSFFTAIECPIIQIKPQWSILLPKNRKTVSAFFSSYHEQCLNKYPCTSYIHIRVSPG